MRNVFGWIPATSCHNACYLGKHITAVRILSDWAAELAQH